MPSNFRMYLTGIISSISRKFSSMRQNQVNECQNLDCRQVSLRFGFSNRMKWANTQKKPFLKSQYFLFRFGMLLLTVAFGRTGYASPLILGEEKLGIK